MSKESNLLSLVEEYQHKNQEIELYYSHRTSIDILLGKNPDIVFIATFGRATKKIDIHKRVVHKHFNTDPEKYAFSHSFKLDTILIRVQDKKIVDKTRARKDVENKHVSTVGNPHKVMLIKPHMIIRAAAIASETGFTPSKPVERAAARNSHRVLQKPGEIVWRELKRLLRARKPSIGIEFLRNTGTLAQILPELSECFGVEQNEKYHKYTVYDHCILACDSADKSDVLLRLAALIHDVGKPDVKGRNKRGITFHKHEVVSTKKAKEIVKRFDLQKDEAEYVVSLVSNHMYQYDRVWKDSTIKRFINKVGLTPDYVGRMEEFPLFKLRHADRRGRGLPPITQKQIDFDKRLEKALLSENN